jgi:hypothetical protein
MPDPPPVRRSFAEQPGKVAENRAAEHWLQAEMGLALKELEQPGVEGVDLSADCVGNFRV